MKEEAKKDLPSEDMAGLLNYLVRPVRDLEEKISGVKKQFDERIHYNLERVDKLIEAVKGHDLRLEDLVREPRKHEVRIGALENISKHVEPMLKELDGLKDGLGKLQKAFEILYELNANVKELKQNYQNLRKEVVDSNVDHEKKLDALHYASDENRRKAQEFKDEMKDKLKLDRNEMVKMHNMQNKKLDEHEKAFRDAASKINDFNNKVEQVNGYASEKVRVAFEELAGKQEDQRKHSEMQHEQVVKELERLSFLFEKNEHRDDSDSKRLEILEMQVEKMALAVKELKVKVDL